MTKGEKSENKVRKEVLKENDNNDEKEFLKDKIEAFEDMLELLNDGSQEKEFIQEKLEAFKDMLELY